MHDNLNKLDLEGVDKVLNESFDTTGHFHSFVKRIKNGIDIVELGAASYVLQ